MTKTRLDRRTVLIGMGASTLGACAGPLQIGEGKKQPKGGIGGTGIVGTLTDFGSIVLNGLRVKLDGETKITDALGKLAEDQLAIGQSLTVEAATLEGTLVARRIHVTHPVIGRVTAEPQIQGPALVDGISVQPEPGMIGELKIGTRVAVSGVWRGGMVVASRVDTLPDRGPSVLAGALKRSSNQPGSAIGPHRLALDSSLLPPLGSFATITWARDDISSHPDKIVPNRFIGAAGPLTGLSIEGFLDPISEPPNFTVAGLGHSFDRSAKLGGFRNLRALFSGSYDGTFQVAEGLPMPEDLGARRAASRALLTGGARLGLPVR